MTTVSVRIPDEQDQALRALAVAADVSVSELVRVALAECIERHRTERANLRSRGREGERRWRLFERVAR